MRTPLSLTILALACVSLSACKHDTAKPSILLDEPVAVVSSNPDPLPPLSNEMAAALHGRTIFVDAGHGGPFTGMVSPSNGIHEADINLRVALKVRDKLSAHGANVLMSRVDDSVPVPDNVSRDLAERAALSNAASPDVFISIHHNADVEAGSQKDDLEVYYKRGDDVASLDLGRRVISALGRGIRFGAANKRLLPGNYKVLRLNEAPSLLLETAYLTNNRDAAYLATGRGIEDEADSIVYGLADYFSLDPPKVLDEPSPSVIVSPSAQPFSIRFSRGTPIDLDSVTVYRDGKNTEAEITATSNGFDVLVPRPLPNGISSFEITGRNMRGAGFRVRRNIVVERNAASMTVTQHPAIAAPGNRVLFEADVRDMVGSPVADGTQVTIAGRNETVKTTGGIASSYFDAEDLAGTLSFVCNSITASISPMVGDRQFQTVTVADSITGESIADAMAWAGNSFVGRTNAEGWIALPRDHGPFRVRGKGYEELTLSKTANSHTVVDLVARHKGALLNRRIAIDPAHGGRVPGVTAPDGSRACDYNLDVALRLARLLENSGAECVLTRTGDDEISDLQRINTTEPFGADVLLTISFGAPFEQTRPLDPVGHLRRDLAAFVGHYPQSVNGIRAATAIGGALRIPKTACVSYMVQQSQSAAIHVQPASLDLRDGTFDATALRGIADSIHQGLVIYFTEMED